MWCFLRVAFATLVVDNAVHGASVSVFPEQPLYAASLAETKAAGVEALRGLVGEKIISTFVVARHGTKAPAAFDYSSVLGADQQKVLAGHPEILETGAKQVEALTARFGAAPGRLLPDAVHCEKAIAQLVVPDDMRSDFYTYSDLDERNVSTALAFMNGIGAVGAPLNKDQPFLVGEGGALVEGCPRATREETETSVLQSQGEKPSDLVAKVEPQLKRLSEVMGVDLLAMPLEWAGPADGPGAVHVTYKGGLLAGCRMTELAVIEVTSGVPNPVYLKLGLKMDELPWLLETCDLLFSFYKNPVNLNRFGGELSVHLLAALAQAATGVRSGLPSVEHDVQTRAVLYASHDVNVDFLRQILKLHWGDSSGELRREADPFHIKLVLQLVQQGNDMAVRAFVVAPSLPARAQHCAALTDADVYALPLCADGKMTCAWHTFREQLTQELHERKPCLTAPTAEWWDKEGDGQAADVGSQPTSARRIASSER